MLASCRHRPPSGEPSGSLPSWPPPPDLPRIAYVRSFGVPEELGIRERWTARFARWLIGSRQASGMARPYAVAVAPDGTIAVADPDAGAVHLFDVARARYRRVRTADRRPLASPIGVAFDERGRLYAADSARSAVFRFDGAGGWEATIGEGVLRRPTGLAFDAARRTLLVVDTLGHRVLGFDEAGRRLLEIGRRGSGEGEFNFPVAVAVDPGGRIHVTDSMNFRVQTFDASGRFLSVFGAPGASPGSFDKAKGIALDAEGHVYVVEGLHDVVQVFDREGALLTVIGGTGNGPGEFVLPAGITVDARGRILVADSANHRVQEFRTLAAPAGSTGNGS